MEEWLYYNFALEVFTQRNFVADFIRLTFKKFMTFKKQKITFLSHTLGLRGNVRAESIACWKASGRLPIRHN